MINNCWRQQKKKSVLYNITFFDVLSENVITFAQAIIYL